MPEFEVLYTCTRIITIRCIIQSKMWTNHADVTAFYSVAFTILITHSKINSEGTAL